MPGSNAESEKVLQRFLDFLQADRRIRVGLAALLLGALALVAGRSAYHLVPRHYTLSITGGDIVSNRHFLARILQAEAPKFGLTLIVEPVSSGSDALERVSQGKLDAAFVQGGMEQTYPNVDHVATVMPELVHLLVKPGIKGMSDLKGRSINMGLKGSPPRAIALTLLRFTGYEENVDYVETNFTAEQLLALPLKKMPDAIITVSSVPSYLVELLVKKHHYQVMEIPFPESLALRHGWAANGTILAYTYDLSPVVPEKNIQTVAVNLHLVASSKADPKAIAQLLEVLYSPSVENRLLQPIDPKRLMIPSGYPISPGVDSYIHRNDTFLTVELWKQAQGIFGLGMSFAGMALMVVRWLRGKKAIVYEDPEYHARLAEVVALEKKALGMAGGPLDAEELRAMRARLEELRIAFLERYHPKAVFKDPALFDRCLAAVRTCEERVHQLLLRAEGQP
ncbi:MAG: TAXI family TRAP transporter solute-binding subunit [Myxococcales bacterium]